MQKQEWIISVCRNGVHAPTAGYIFENIREIQLLKDKVKELENRLEQIEITRIEDEPVTTMIEDEKIPKSKNLKKQPTNKVKSAAKSDEDF